MSNAIDLSIPSWHGVIENIPQEDANVHTALHAAIKFQEGLESLSAQQFLDPIIAGQINTRMTELGGMIGLPTPNITTAVSTERLAVVSQEGVADVFLAIIKKAMKWLVDFKDWIVGWIKDIKVTSKAQEAASSSVKTAAAKANTETPPETRKTQGTFTLPGRALVVFHSPNHLPKIGYTYNAKHLKASLANILKGAEVMQAALEDELEAMVTGVDIVADAVLSDKPIQVSEMYKMTKYRKMAGLAHNGMKFIGLAVESRPVSSDYSVRKEKYQIVNFGREEGWYNDGRFTLTISSDELKGYTEDAANAVKSMNKISDSIQSKVSNSKVVSRIESLRKYVDGILKTSEALEPAQQNTLMKRLLAVQELVMNLQVNVQTYDLFSKNYNNMLISVGNSTVTRIRNIDKALNGIDDSLNT